MTAHMGGLEWNRREHLHTLARTLSHANVATAHNGCADRVVTDRVLWSVDASGCMSIERCTGAYCHCGLRCVELRPDSDGFTARTWSTWRWLSSKLTALAAM